MIVVGSVGRIHVQFRQWFLLALCRRPVRSAGSSPSTRETAAACALGLARSPVPSSVPRTAPVAPVPVSPGASARMDHQLAESANFRKDPLSRPCSASRWCVVQSRGYRYLASEAVHYLDSCGSYSGNSSSTTRQASRRGQDRHASRIDTGPSAVRPADTEQALNPVSTCSEIEDPQPR